METVNCHVRAFCSIGRRYWHDFFYTLLPRSLAYRFKMAYIGQPLPS